MTVPVVSSQHSCPPLSPARVLTGLQTVPTTEYKTETVPGPTVTKVESAPAVTITSVSTYTAECTSKWQDVSLFQLGSVCCGRFETPLAHSGRRAPSLSGLGTDKVLVGPKRTRCNDHGDCTLPNLFRLVELELRGATDAQEGFLFAQHWMGNALGRHTSIR